MKSNYKTNKILIDWFSFTISGLDVPELVQMMGFDGVVFTSLKGNRGYADKMYSDGVSIHYNKTSEDMADIWVEMSGQGCRVFETYGNGDWVYLFSYLLSNDSINITRIDVAYDDFNYLIDLEEIVVDVLSQHYVSKSRGTWDLRLSNEGTCVSIGKSKSNISCRIYDKAAERHVQGNIDHWVRCELQLRYQNAMQFCLLLCKHQLVMLDSAFDGIAVDDGVNIDRLYFGVLNNYLRFIDVECNDDSNLWRKPMAKHWERFAHSVTDERISLWVSPGVEYNVLRLDHVVENMFSGATVTYALIHGIEKLVEVLIKRIPTLNIKYKYLLRDFYSQSGHQLCLEGGFNFD